MTPPLRPANITESDELKSLQFYLSLEFPSDEIRRSRPHEDEQYDMLIDPSAAMTFESRGSYMAETSMSITIQRWCDSFDEAAHYAEGMARLFMIGRTPGNKSRVPVWLWSFELPQVQPEVGTDEPDRFLRVGSCETRILQADKPTSYVAICEVQLRGWRITHTFTDQLIEEVDITQEQL